MCGGQKEEEEEEEEEEKEKPCIYWPGGLIINYVVTTREEGPDWPPEASQSNRITGGLREDQGYLWRMFCKALGWSSRPF